MSILITGGAGFIGSHLCTKYATEDGNVNTVICLDNFSNGDVRNIRHLVGRRNFKLVTGDVRDKELMRDLTRDADVIMHLAAQVHTDKSLIVPRDTYDINVMGTLNVLENARMHDVGCVLFASSSEVYGSAKYAPMDEYHALDPDHPYGASKAAADRLCSAYYKTYGVEVRILRSFNTYGEGQKDRGYGAVISLFIRRCLEGKPPIIYGDGTQTRDFMYISDAVAAYDAMLIHGGACLGPINFGTGKDVSINALANMIMKKTGLKMEPVYVERRAGEVDKLVADATKAKNELGWAPKVTIQEGLDRMIEWYRTGNAEELKI